MAVFKMDMSNERRPKELFKPGDSVVKILSMEFQTSKSGNKMFKCEIQQAVTGATDTFFLVAEEKKRWLLKSLLDATGQYKKDENNMYVFDPDKIIGMDVVAEIYHEEQPWTDTNGNETTVKNNKIKKFKKSEYTTDKFDVDGGNDAIEPDDDTPEF